MKLNKKDFIRKIAETSDSTSKTVQSVLHHFQQVLLEVLKTEKEVQLLDIGKLKISHRKSRSGVNPKTKAPIVLPAKDVPRLASSKKLKALVANEGDVSVSSFKYFNTEK